MAASMLGTTILSALKKQPQKFVRCLQLYPSPKSTDEEEEKVVEYPPIKPRYPPGKWGKMKEKHAWEIHEEGERLKTLPLLRERITYLSKDNPQIPKWKVPPLNENIGLLPYQQFITRTHLEKGLPKSYDSIEVSDEKIELITKLIKQCLAEEGVKLQRDHVTSQYPPVERKSLLRRYFIGRLVDIVSSVLSTEHPHLMRAQIDTDVKIEAFWKLHGFSEDVVVRTRSKFGDTRFQTEFNVCKQLRTELPLAEFEPSDSPVCDGEFPPFEYSPKTIGQFTEKFTDCRWLPGFRLGDPCEFTSVMVNDYSRRTDRLVELYSADELKDILVGFGMVSSFASLVAQAHYQGFNMYHELTYPLTMQTVNTDGQYWSFFAYQLNSLQLFKDKEANLKRNLCWYTEPVKLYDDIDDAGAINFNVDALTNFIKFFANKPVDRGVELRPYLSSEFNPSSRDTKEFFPYRPKYPRWCQYPEFLEGSVKGYL